ncbi:hypothetical protein NMG60_11024679 [Bertholletia excelsa]
MHCQGCAYDIIKILRGFDGVEQIETDTKNHRVTVKGKKADPKKVLHRLRKKTNRHVNLISPILKEKQEEKKEEKKEEPKVVEVVLKIFMHCDGCAKDIKRCIHKMNGVYTVEPDMKSSQVTVRGAFEPTKLVEYVNKKTGKHVAIVKQMPLEKKEDEKCKKCQQEREEKWEYYEIHPPGLVYAPQIFSDENPNACSVM